MLQDNNFVFCCQWFWLQHVHPLVLTPAIPSVILSERNGDLNFEDRALKIVFTIFLLCCLSPLPTPAAEWGPGSFSSPSPTDKTFSDSKTVSTDLPEKSPLAVFLLGGVRFFRKVISPVDGDRCTMAPTCSHFGLQAIKKHGALIGFMMTADRIVHEYEEQRFVPTRWDGTSYRFLDPVENNDFWFAAPLQENGTGALP